MPPTAYTPHEDYGFFGPDSITWKVWSYPTSLTVGFIRAVVVEELDPALVAAVDKTHDIYKRPRTRYDRTLRYFAMVAFGGSRETSKAADVLVRIHSKAIGHDPYSGEPYDANDPHSQLWIHLTAWHSILYSYEKYGPGRLSAEEEARYWHECAVAAELQTCSPDDVPTTREGIAAYFEQMRPTLSGSPIARQAMDHLLDGASLVSPLPRLLSPLTWAVNAVLRAGVIATLPRWMRELSGIRQPRVVDALVVPVLRVAFVVLHLSKRAELRVLGMISPGTVPVAAPVLLGIPPLTAEVITPAEARARYGYDKPAEAHLEWRAKQHAKVFGEGGAPSDAGLRESEAILGPLSEAG
ncbi:oxygenase MpaB family protein [Nocardioides limicola]|uniref:oxygenase MpaB family protein n=1 Tax=Nocardioides limicola TaxID=2803368 RepID=UPI00193B7375|nr:oxygenase MpaB family protein [Nocardioides sp. DJM-14]